MPEAYAPSLEDGRSVERELVSSLSWLIGLRWLGGLAVLLGTLLATGVLSLALPAAPLYLLGLAVLGYNAVFWWVHKRLVAQSQTPVSTYQWFARIQIGVDWMAMTLLVYLTGGIESPAIICFLFHIIIASLLLPHDRGFVYVTLAPCLLAGVASMEYAGLIPHITVFAPPRYGDPVYVAGVLLVFAGACYVMAYLSMTISRRLRRREDQLAGLYRSARATTSTLSLPEVLDRLAEATAKALGCRAAAIRLLDTTGTSLEMTGAYGLSEDFRKSTPMAVTAALVDQEALLGRVVLVKDAANDERLRYPDKYAAEGIGTILSAPLIGKTGPIGVVHAYRRATQGFSEDDAEFVTAIAAQGAVAIENAQAYELVQELDADKSQFVRIVTHELRSPVQVASSLLNVLDEGYVGELSEKQGDLVSRARRRMAYLEKLIDDLLDLAAGKAEVLASAERGLVSLNGVVEEIAQRYEAPAQEKGLALRVETPEATLHAWGDRSELDRVLNNLAGNAVKYTQQGEVRLRLAADEDRARFTVSDTGIGIPADELPNLFQEFFRAKNAKELEDAGTGLGLSIVKDLVTRYGGEIDVESEEGRGTTFIVTLPLAAPGAEAIEG